jgi:hypothetical protein
MKIDSLNVILFRELVKSSNPVDIFHFHEKYQFSPEQLANFISKNLKKGLISFSLNQIALTTKGLDWAKTKEDILIYGKRKKYWKEIPFNFILQNDTNSLIQYIPNLSKNDIQSFLKYKAKEK